MRPSRTLSLRTWAVLLFSLFETLPSDFLVLLSQQLPHPPPASLVSVLHSSSLVLAPRPPSIRSLFSSDRVWQSSLPPTPTKIIFLRTVGSYRGLPSFCSPVSTRVLLHSSQFPPVGFFLRVRPLRSSQLGVAFPGSQSLAHTTIRLTLDRNKNVYTTGQRRSTALGLP